MYCCVYIAFATIYRAIYTQLFCHNALKVGHTSRLPRKLHIVTDNMNHTLVGGVLYKEKQKS